MIGADVTSDAHRAVAARTIVEGSVLLKNDGDVLPLATSGKKIAMIGRYCKDKTDKDYGQGSVFSGGGSGYVDTKVGFELVGSALSEGQGGRAARCPFARPAQL